MTKAVPSSAAKPPAASRRMHQNGLRSAQARLAELKGRLSAHSSASYDAWTRARQIADFATMRPYLERTLELSREYAELFAPYQHVIDPLIDDMDEGMTCASVRALFAELRGALLPIV